MTEVIGVRFKQVGKVYYFAPKGAKLQVADYVVVETTRGTECGEVVMANRMIDDASVVAPLKPMLRIATEKDIQTMKHNHEKEEEATRVCQEKIIKHNLNMKLVEVE